MRFRHGDGQRRARREGASVSAALSSSASYAAHISVTSSYCFEYLSTANLPPIRSSRWKRLEAAAARAVRRARTPSPRTNAYIRRMHAAAAGLSCPAMAVRGRSHGLSAHAGLPCHARCMLTVQTIDTYRATSSALSSPRLAASHCGYLSRISTSGAYLPHYIHACTHIYARGCVSVCA